MNASELVEYWVKHLRKMEKKRGALGTIAQFRNGPEAWFKFELGAALVQAKGHKPAQWDEDGDWDYGDVGLEYRAGLRRNTTAGASRHKGETLIDLYVSASPGHDDSRCHYIELKVVRNWPAHLANQRGSFEWDIRTLNAVKADEMRESAIGIIFGIEFETQEEWKDAVQGLDLPGCKRIYAEIPYRDYDGGLHLLAVIRRA